MPFGGTPVKSGDRSARVDAKRSTPSTGPRAGAVGAKDIPKSKYPSRGTNSPVK